MMVVEGLQRVLLLLVAAHVAWTVFMHVCTWRYFATARHEEVTPPYEPTVSIIKPTKGVDQCAYSNFRSFCNQEYGGDYELVFCIEGSSDPVIPAVRRLMAEHPGKQIRLVLSDPADLRSFGKLKNMIAGVAASSYEVVIFSDSDCSVPPTFLRDTVAPTRNPAVGIAFGTPAYTGSQNWPAALTSISVNELTLRIVTLHLFGLFKGAIGTTMAVRREVIESIGGLEQLGWQIADDIQLARIIHQHGYHIHLLKDPARVLHHHDSLRGWWSHAHRWLVVVRRYWPVHFVLMSVIDVALWWSLIYVGLGITRGANVSIGLGLVGIALVTALLSAVVVNVAVAHNVFLWRHIWVVWMLELLRLPLLLYSSFTNDVVWRSRRLHVESDGTTTSVETGKASDASSRG